VAFHESFWVVTGTAAPVIALAAIVSLADADREFMGFLVTALSDFERIKPFMNRAAFTGIWIGVSGLLNLLLQATLLTISLVSLAEDVNSVPPWSAIAMAVGGVILLAVSAWGAVTLHVFRLATMAMVSKTTNQTPPPGEKR
jgi:hypothetical protein